MYDKLIAKYIDKLNCDMVINFAKKEGCLISLEDAEVLTSVIKSDWKNLLHGDPSKSFLKIKDRISENAYQKAVDLFNKYRKML